MPPRSAPAHSVVRGARRARQRGYTYLLLLFAVAAMGLLTALAAESWTTLAQREREAELLFVGNQYREALRRYDEALPGTDLRGPARLEELLRDPRFPDTRRYLRQLYADPVTGRFDWVLVREGGRIVGLHSRSTQTPLKSDGFLARDNALRGGKTYADWLFGRGAISPASTKASAGAASGEPPRADSPNGLSQ